MTERPDKLNNQAILLASGGEYTEAIACFKRAIIIQRDNYLLWYNLGVTYRDSGDLKNAVSALEKASSPHILLAVNQRCTYRSISFPCFQKR